MHLYVKPPDGKVSVSAPLSMSDEAIERFVRTKFNWIRNQISKFDNQQRQSEREYVSGETFYVWGNATISKSNTAIKILSYSYFSAISSNVNSNAVPLPFLTLLNPTFAISINFSPS